MKNVLVIDDDKNLCNVLQVAFENDDTVALTFVHNADEADTVLQQKQFDLILLDILMPGVTGVVWLENKRAQNVSLPPIIVMTNFDSHATTDVTKKLGVESSFVKSKISMAELRGLIRR